MTCQKRLNILLVKLYNPASRNVCVGPCYMHVGRAMCCNTVDVVISVCMCDQ